MTSLDLMVASYTGTSTGEEVQIICDCCNQVKLEKTLYSCLQCIDVDLCKECYTAGTPFGSHRRTHTCVWQRAGTSSFTCSCGERHIIRTLFEEHLKSERHQNWVNGVTSGNTGTDNNSTNQDSTDSHVSSSPSNNYSPSSPSSYTPTTPSTPSGEMTSRSRTADLLGTYLPSNQSSAVPSTSSYSTLSRASSYLDPPSTSSYTRRNSNYSEDSLRPSVSPSRYGTTDYDTTTSRRNRYDPDSYSTTRSSRYGNDSETPSYTSRYSRDSGSSSFPTTETAPRSARTLELDRLSRNLDRNVASILSGDYQRRRDRDDSTLGSSLGSSLNETTTSRRSRFNRTPSPERNADGLTAEEAEAAAKKIGWVDEKEAENRIGTGWWEEQKKKKDSPGDNDIRSDQPGSSGLKSGSSSLLSRAEKTSKASNIEEENIDDGLSPDEIMARMNNSNVNEFGRDPEKGEISFLAQCQCFRAEYDVVKKNSKFLIELYEEHTAENGSESFIPVEMSPVILNHLLNSFYAMSNLKLEKIEWLLLLYAAQKYKCSKTRDFCVRKIRAAFEQPDPTTLPISLDIVSRYSENPPAELDALVATAITYMIGTNAFKKIENVKPLHKKIFNLKAQSLCQLATGAAEIADAETIISFCRVVNLWAGEQRESSRGSHLLEILNYLQLSDKCTPKDVAQIVQMHHFNENYETVSFLAMIMSNMLIG